MANGNGNPVSNIVNAYAQAGLAGVLAVVLSLNMYFAHTREQAEIQADAINLKAINESNKRAAAAMESWAESARTDSELLKKQGEAIVERNKLLREQNDILRKKE